MVRFEDLRVFVAAARHGSFSAAARELDVTPAVASVALKRVEEVLQTRLFVRSTRSLRLTVDGRRYLEYATQALDALAAGHDAIARDKTGIAGTLSLSVPSDLGRNLVLGWLDEFQARHPAVDFQLRVSDRLADMYRQPVDVALRYGGVEDANLVALPLAENRRVVCGSPAYFAKHGMPATPADLRDHNCLCFMLDDSVHDRWTFHAGEETVMVPVSGDRISDDGDLVRRWALQGKGLAYKSHLDVLGDLRGGGLQTALDGYPGEASALCLVCVDRGMLSPAVRHLHDFLRESVQAYLGQGQR